MLLAHDDALRPQLYLKLVAGEYVPAQNVVHLREFGEQLVAGRAVRGEFLARGVKAALTFAPPPPCKSCG